MCGPNVMACRPVRDTLEPKRQLAAALPMTPARAQAAPARSELANCYVTLMTYVQRHAPEYPMNNNFSACMRHSHVIGNKAQPILGVQTGSAAVQLLANCERR